MRILTFCSVSVILVSGMIPFGAKAGTLGFDFTQCSTASNGWGVAQTENSACESHSYSNNSGSFSQTIGSGATAVTVTATAYVSATNSAATGTPLISGNNATAGQYFGNGLGICSLNNSEYDPNAPWGCADPYHQVDDSSNYEFALLTFSTPVNLSQLALADFGGTNGTASLDQMGFTYWVNPSSEASIPDGGTTVLCGTSGAPACPSVEGDGQGIGGPNDGTWISGFGTNGQTTLNDVSQILIASDLSETNDFFKIQGVTGTVVPSESTPTPEPSTFGLGLGLIGLGLYARKRHASQRATH